MNKNKNLIKFRKKSNKTPEEMAEIVGVSTSYYYKIESGARNPSFNFIKKFKDSFNIKIEDIFFTNSLHVECDESTKKNRAS